MNEYHKQAEDFLTKHNATFTIKKQSTPYKRQIFNNDKNICKVKAKNDLLKSDDRFLLDKYTLTLSRNGRSFDFDFTNSINDTIERAYGSKDTAPKAYDLLACVQKCELGTFDDFCEEFGYFPINSQKDYHKAQEIYTACQEEYFKIKILFGDVMDELHEIQ